MTPTHRHLDNCARLYSLGGPAGVVLLAEGQGHIEGPHSPKPRWHTQRSQPLAPTAHLGRLWLLFPPGSVTHGETPCLGFARARHVSIRRLTSLWSATSQPDSRRERR